MKMNKSKFISITLFWLTAGWSQAWAHCPFSFDFKNQSYCLAVEWVNGQSRIKGQFFDVNELSPILNPLSLRPEKWIYSRAKVNVWMASDSDHKPVFIPELKLYPFMVMLGGHNHGAKADFQWSDESQAYILSQMAFQEMSEGCWQIHMSLDSKEQKVLSIEKYENLSAEENYNQVMMCDLCNSVRPLHENHNP